MTPAEFRDRMEQIVATAERENDSEKPHSDVDKLMSSVLTDLGYSEGIKIYERMPRWA
jgi:hypothetical protein